MRIWKFAALLLACGSDSGGGPLSDGSVTVKGVELPYADGQTTGVAYTLDDKLLAVVDGQLVAVAADGGPFTVINADPVHVGLAVAPDGYLYASTGSEIRTYAPGATTPTTVDVEDGAVHFSFSPTNAVIASIISAANPSTIALRSTDHGATWTGLTLHNGGPGFAYNGDVVYAPNGDILVSTWESFHRSVDDGQTWTSHTPGPRASFGCCLVGLANGDILHFAAGAGGLQRSADGGMTWSQLTPFNEPPLWRQVLERPDGSLLGLGNLDAGGGGIPIRGVGALHSSNDGGATWSERILVNAHAFAAKGDRIALGLGYPAGETPWPYGGVFESFDDGSSWVPSGNTPIDNEFVEEFTWDTEDRLMVVAHHAVYRRTAEGWRAMHYDQTGLGGLAVMGDGTIVLLSRGFYTSSDDGRSWSRRDLAVEIPVGLRLRSVLETYTNDNLLLAYDDFNPAPAGILIRSNLTTDVQVPMPGAVVQMAQERGGTIYALTWDLPDIKHHQSFDGAMSFQEMPPRVAALDYNGAGRYLASVNIDAAMRYVLINPADEQQRLFISGLPHEEYLVTRARFSPDDHLYLLSGSGLFESTEPVR